MITQPAPVPAAAGGFNRLGSPASSSSYVATHTLSTSRHPISRATMAAGISPPRLMATRPSTAPPGGGSASRDAASARASACSWSQVTVL